MTAAREKAGKDEVDEEEADDCGGDEEIQTEAEGIIAWHGRRQCVCHHAGCPPI